MRHVVSVLVLGVALSLATRTARAQETGGSFGGGSFHEHHESFHEHHESFHEHHESHSYRPSRPSPSHDSYHSSHSYGSGSSSSYAEDPPPAPVVWPAGDHGRRRPTARERALMGSHDRAWLAVLVGAVAAISVLGVSLWRSRR